MDESEYNLYIRIQSSGLCSAGGVKLLTIGKLGVGKSTLINKFLNLPDSLNHAALVRRSPNSVTTTVESYKSVVYNLPIQIFDTPGLGSCNCKDEADILQKIASAFKETDPDLLLYCASLRQRFDDSDKYTVKILTRSLGKKIWERAIFILTSADVVIEEQGLNEIDESDSTLQSLIDEYVQEFQKTLQELKCKIPVKSAYSFQYNGSLLSSISSKSREYSKGIVAFPVSNKPNIPQDWKCALALESLQKVKEQKDHNVYDEKIVWPLNSSCIIL